MSPLQAILVIIIKLNVIRTKYLPCLNCIVHYLSKLLLKVKSYKIVIKMGSWRDFYTEISLSKKKD